MGFAVLLNRVLPVLVDWTTRRRFVITEREDELRAAGLL